MRKKWNILREVVNRVLDDLQRLYVHAQNQALKKWFDEVIESEKVVEVKRNMKQIWDSPHYMDLSRMIPEAVKSGLDTSWITQMLKNLLKALNKKDPKEVKLVEKLQEDLFEQKMMFEDLRRQLAEVKEEQKQQRSIQEAQIKKTEDMEMTMKQQFVEIKSGIASLIKMMQQQQP